MLVVVLVLDLLGFCHERRADPPAIILFRRYERWLLVGYAALAALTSSGSLRKSSISAATSVAVRPSAARAQAECLRYPGARGLLWPLFAAARVKGEF